MTIQTPYGPLSQSRSRFRELFTSKLVTILAEGYGLGALRADIVAGLTVAIVVLPLSMAIAIASGATPERGLYAAVVGGFLVSALGGSRFQIGGPAGAFIILVAASVDRHGIDAVLLATAMAGVFLTIAGFLPQEHRRRVTRDEDGVVPLLAYAAAWSDKGRGPFGVGRGLFLQFTIRQWPIWSSSGNGRWARPPGRAAADARTCSRAGP